MGPSAGGSMPRRMRVLLIEDDREAARLLAKGLREEGWVVDIAHSGESGDEMASVNTYDAVVLDWLLPDRDGIAVCRGLRRAGLHVPILLLTARDAVEDRVHGPERGGPTTTSRNHSRSPSCSPGSTRCSAGPT